MRTDWPASALALLMYAVLFGHSPAFGHEPAVADRSVTPADATTLHRKVMCGYQGWFRCPGDGADEGWRHWSRNTRRIAPDTLTVEMWPDLSDHLPEEKFAAPGFTYPDDSPAQLFSSHHPQTVARHFEWMKQYGIDGAFLQRFLVNVGSRSNDQVLSHVRKSAASSGRTYAVCYDLSGMPENRLQQRLAADWKRLVDELKLTSDDLYLHHDGKPVVFVWGFYSDRFSSETAHRLIDLFQGDDRYAATLIGGCQWYWRAEPNAEWARAFRRFDVLSPWNVGNVTSVDGQKHAATAYWKDDLAEIKRSGSLYLPVVYPGFGWRNLKGRAAAKDDIPRLGGEFFWRQFRAVDNLGIDMAYVAMFDEVDEATAIFKVTDTPPTQARFQTYEGLPSDWYLRLTGAGGKVLRGECEPTESLPITP